MRKNILISTVAAAALCGSAAFVVPALADTSVADTAATTSTTADQDVAKKPGGKKGDKKEGDRQKERQQRIEKRIRADLQELVDNGTITAEQADQIAKSLAEKASKRGPGHRPGKPGEGQPKPGKPGEGDDKAPGKPGEGEQPKPGKPGEEAPSDEAPAAE